MSRLIEQLKRHEGFRSNPYICTAGKLTIGYGRNLDNRGISEDEAIAMLNNDISDCRNMLERGEVGSIYLSLCDVRRDCLVNMCFQLGYAGISKFVKMWNFLILDDFHGAAVEMLDSKWAKQTPERASELAEQMRSGQYQK